MLKHTIAFDPAHDEQAFAQLPSAKGVFALRGRAGEEPYVSKSSNVRRKVKRLLAPPESQNKRLNLRERCGAIEFTATGSDFENVLLLYRTLRDAFPDSYPRRLRLAMSPLVRFHWENAYPRAYVTRKLGKTGAAGASTHYGPFRSRASAEKYLNDVLDLFKSRRCTFELAPDPSFPGCVYSEMKMCLAPCFQGCSDDDYFAETSRVEEFIATRGESLLSGIATEREAASTALEFEKASTLHARYEKVKGIAHEADELIHRIDKLEAILIQPSAEPDSVELFSFQSGVLSGPQNFSVLGMLLADPGSGQSSLHIQPMMVEPTPLADSSEQQKPNKPEARLRAAIESFPRHDRPTVQEQMENLALLKNWYYRSSRVGEIFFCEDGAWPWRRILNGVSRVYVSAHKNAAADQGLRAADQATEKR